MLGNIAPLVIYNRPDNSVFGTLDSQLFQFDQSISNSEIRFI